VVTYRIWFKEPGDQTWTKVGDGHTGDGFPGHHVAGPLVDRTLVAYYLIIVGNAHTDFVALVTLSQDGKLLPGGSCVESGRLNDNKRAVKERRLELI
jgi:hypothetical protein